MKKKLLFFAALLFTLPVFSAKTIDGLIDIIKYNQTATSSDSKIELLKQFVGDAIIIEVESPAMSQNFINQVPDTLWIKKRPKKNLELGKHYVLNYAYKSIDDNGTFKTPVREINGIPFSLLEIGYDRQSGTASGRDILLKLQNLNDLSVFYFKIPEKNADQFILYIPRVKKELEDMAGSEFYINSNGPRSSYHSPEYNHVTLEGGDFKIRNNSGYSYGKLEALLSVNLKDDAGETVTLDYPTARNNSKNKYIIDKDAYIDYLDSKTIRKINSELDADILNSEKELPFEFSYIYANRNGYSSYISQSIDPQSISGSRWTNSYKSAPDDVMIVGGVIDVRGKRFYKMIYNGKAFFMDPSDVMLEDENSLTPDFLAGLDEETQNLYFQICLLGSKKGFTDRIGKALNEYKEKKKYGLGIEYYKVYDESEYTSGTGFDVLVFNPTDQIIKYITFVIQGYNAVDDPVGGPLTQRCIGPIEPDDFANYTFEYLWFTDIVEYAKIKSITVNYKNGTTKKITNPNLAVISDETYDLIHSTNPVENLE